MAEPGSQDGVAASPCGTGQDDVEGRGCAFHGSALFDAGENQALFSFCIYSVCGLIQASNCRVNNHEFTNLK